MFEAHGVMCKQSRLDRCATVTKRSDAEHLLLKRLLLTAPEPIPTNNLHNKHQQT
jgi:hypothetical protein